MRWWPFKRKAPHSNGGENGGAAERARIEASQKLREAYRRQREVDETVRTTESLLRQNQFGEQVQQAFRRAT